MRFDAADIEPMITYGTNPGMGMVITRHIPTTEGMSETAQVSFKKSLDYMGFQPGESLLGKKIDYVFLGACTNGRIEDFRAFASIVKGRKKAENVIAWLDPGTWMVDAQIRKEGIDKILTEAGFAIRQPGCSACLAMNDDKIPAGDINDYVTPTFYAPNASWLVQRNGMDKRHSLMIAQNASEGNHMHANGISMELYGKGYRLAPDGGIGLTLYSGLDYLEYYSQFPAHNTVCVDGISSYPVMKSNHAFKLLNCYPEAGMKVDYQPVSYSEVFFREPESQADQNRMMSIVTTGEKNGYYVDIFRSRKVEGGDKMHDYFYHNMGQTMNLTAADGSSLSLQPTEELAFAGAHIYAYSYLFDKKSAETSKDIKTTFTIQMPDEDNISMNMWMKGAPERKVFSALSPMTEGLSRIPDMPYAIKEQPTLTFVARQQGEAWNRPFVAVYEPSSVKEPGCISSVTFPEVESGVAGSHVGICIQQKEGRVDRIISSDDAGHLCKSGEMTVQAAYALWGNKQGDDCIFFLGGGTLLKTPHVEISSLTVTDVMLVYKEGVWKYAASTPCKVRMNGKEYNLLPGHDLRKL